MPSRSPFALRVTLVLLPAVLAAGCGGPRLVSVTGTALRHGKPVPDLVINFAPEKGLRSYALTDQNGRFTMVCSNGQEGVLVGTHKVWVQLHTAGSKEDKERQKRVAMQKNDPEIAQMLRKYGNPETTPITVDAKEDQEINLALD
jgi:hypothetical protein